MVVPSSTMYVTGRRLPPSRLTALVRPSTGCRQGVRIGDDCLNVLGHDSESAHPVLGVLRVVEVCHLACPFRPNQSRHTCRLLLVQRRGQTSSRGSD